MLPNIVENNSVIIRVKDIEPISYKTSYNGVEYVELAIKGESHTLKMRLDPIGANGIRMILNCIQTDIKEVILPQNPMNTFACYYQWAYVNGVVIKDDIAVSPAFEKIPARTKNENGGKFDDIDDDGLFVFCPFEKDFQRIWFAFSTSHAIINAYSEDVKFIIFEFNVSDMIRDNLDKYCTVVGKLRYLLDEAFPMNRFGELNRDCYDYIYRRVPTVLEEV